MHFYYRQLIPFEVQETKCVCIWNYHLTFLKIIFSYWWFKQLVHMEILLLMLCRIIQLDDRKIQRETVFLRFKSQFRRANDRGWKPVPFVISRQCSAFVKLDILLCFCVAKSQCLKLILGSRQPRSLESLIWIIWYLCGVTMARRKCHKAGPPLDVSRFCFLVRIISCLTYILLILLIWFLQNPDVLPSWIFGSPIFVVSGKSDVDQCFIVSFIFGQFLM